MKNVFVIAILASAFSQVSLASSEFTQSYPFRPGSYSTEGCVIDGATFSQVYIHGHPANQSGSLVVVFGDRYQTHFPTANHRASLSPMWDGANYYDVDLVSTDVASWDPATGVYFLKEKIRKRESSSKIYDVALTIKTTKDGLSLDFVGPAFHRLDAAPAGHCDLVFIRP